MLSILLRQLEQDQHRKGIWVLFPTLFVLSGWKLEKLFPLLSSMVSVFGAQNLPRGMSPDYQNGIEFSIGGGVQEITQSSGFQTLNASCVYANTGDLL